VASTDPAVAQVRVLSEPGETRFRARLPHRVTVALVTAGVARDLDDDLPPLAAALDRRGVAHDVVAWDDPAVDWRRFVLAVVRSVWDYPRRRGELLAWAEAVAAATALLNPPAILRWSSDKRYLAELAEAGVPVVPTAFAAPGDAMAWPGGEVVVKPVVSAGSLDTDRYPEGRRAEAEAHVARLHADGRAAMAQPYLPAVEEAGETAMVFLDGAFSHAVRKGPLLVPGLEVVGDLFVEESIAPAKPTAGESVVARAALAAVPGGADGLLYARVDLVPGPDGRPLVIELELLEPSLFLTHAPGAADRLAEAIAARLTSVPG
jgi:glutathione synthase/RimK-type ligase-like ATP-grasp enzyme